MAVPGTKLIAIKGKFPEKETLLELSCLLKRSLDDYMKKNCGLGNF